MVLNGVRRAVGVFPSHQATEQALDGLEDSGFPMDKVSLIVLDRDWQDRTSDTGQPIQHHAFEKIASHSGPTLLAKEGPLLGLSSLFIPDLGSVILAGAAGSTLATHITAAVSYSERDLLVGLDLPEEPTEAYNALLLLGHYLVVVDGSEEEIQRAEFTLSRYDIQEWNIYDVSGKTNEEHSN